jgi:hypothetical protein
MAGRLLLDGEEAAFEGVWTAGGDWKTTANRRKNSSLVTPEVMYSFKSRFLQQNNQSKCTMERVHNVVRIEQDSAVKERARDHGRQS